MATRYFRKDEFLRLLQNMRLTLEDNLLFFEENDYLLKKCLRFRQLKRVNKLLAQFGCLDSVYGCKKRPSVDKNYCYRLIWN